jgi:hypothetical protein
MTLEIVISALGMYKATPLIYTGNMSMLTASITSELEQ